MTDLPESKDFGDYGKWPGRAVLDPTGRRLGEVREIYLDDATERPEWVLVELEDGARFVPLVDAQVENDAIRVAQASDRVQAAPSLEVQTELTQDEERRLYSHYGLSYSEDTSDSLLPELDGTTASEGDGDGAAPETLAASSGSETAEPPAGSGSPRSARARWCS